MERGCTENPRRLAPTTIWPSVPHETTVLGGVQGRAALDAASAPCVRCALEVAPMTPGPCHAHVAGFDLHAGLVTRAGQRDRLERLCRYALRPPLAQDRLHVSDEGEIWLTLRHRWADGTTTGSPTSMGEGRTGAARRPSTSHCCPPRFSRCFGRACSFSHVADAVNGTYRTDAAAAATASLRESFSTLGGIRRPGPSPERRQ